MLKIIAAAALSILLSFCAWLILSGLISFAQLEWTSVTGMARGRFVFGALTIYLVYRSIEAVGQTKP